MILSPLRIGRGADWGEDMGFGVRCGLAIALLATGSAEVFASVDPAPLTADALAGAWTLQFTPGGKGVTVRRSPGSAEGPVLFSVQFAGRNGRLTGCTVRQDSPAGEVVPARCTLQRGRLVVQVMDGGNGMAFALANTPGGVKGDASLKLRMLPFSPKIGTAVLTRDR